MTPQTQQLPKRNWPLVQWLGETTLRLLGWRIDNTIPDLAKAVFVVAPHTSNWDFVIGMATALALDLDANWLGKHNLFCGPCGKLLRHLGGIPVDRSNPHNLLKQVVTECHQRQYFLLGLSPEGTRHPVTTWKTGACRLAAEAGIPLVPVAIDYRSKQIRVFPHWIPDADINQNMVRISDHFTAAMAKQPNNFQPHKKN